ncbi:MAG: hypothetical protein KDD51_09675 [Bdellovibrionales bacterium]|nr:hypothetical protein [Bdellovibrionales bacterium]
MDTTLRVWSVLLLLIVSGRSFSDDVKRLSSKLENPDEVRKYYDIDSDLLDKADASGVKVAVLSKGFRGAEDQDAKVEDFFRKRYLPQSMKLFSEYDVASFGLEGRNEIGRRVAQTIWSLSGLADDGPEFHLYNANGLVAFREAANALVEWGADVVVCTENFSAFGNFDGTGIVNRLVDLAAIGEMIWIQSAGEFATKVINLPIKVKERKLDQPDPQVKVFADDTEATLTLSWNAYSPGFRRFYGTDKDLDMILYDNKGTEVASSRTRQVEGDAGDGESNFAVEQMTAKLFKDRSPYYIRIRIENGDFDPRSDELRLTVDTDRRPFFDGQKEQSAIELVDGNREKSIPVPADNKWATTVGSTHPFSSEGPTADGRKKPDLVLDGAESRYTDKVAISGPNIAAAQLGALAVLYKANFPRFNRKHWLLALQRSSLTPKGELKPDRKKSAYFGARSRDEIHDLMEE